MVRVDPRGAQSGDINRMMHLVHEARDRLAQRDYKGFTAAAARVNTEVDAGRARGKAFVKGLGEGVVNAVLGTFSFVGNAIQPSFIATEYRVNFTRPGRVWQQTDRFKDWDYTKEALLNATILYPIGHMLGELPASALVASSSEYSQTARLEASANAGRLTPSFVLTVASGRPALQTAKTVGIRLEAARAAAASPWPSITRQYRTYSERVIALTPRHPLKGLLDPETGRFLQPPSRKHADLAQGPYVEMMHVTSRKAGGTERVAVGDAWTNQVDNILVEHPHKGGVVQNRVVTIGGVQVEARSAAFLEQMGALPPGTLAGATKASGWTPWW